MATFQIHEDIENIHSKINLKKYADEVGEKKKTKKKFGENNAVAIQPLNKNCVKGVKATKIPIKNYKAGQGQSKKIKIGTGSYKDEVSF